MSATGRPKRELPRLPFGARAGRQRETCYN